jgi:predicted CopG family antitoxin
MKSIKISDGTYVELLKLKASLTAQNGKTRTFDEAIGMLLNSYKETK